MLRDSEIWTRSTGHRPRLQTVQVLVSVLVTFPTALTEHLTTLDKEGKVCFGLWLKVTQSTMAGAVLGYSV